MSQLKINKNKEKIVKLLNENIDLEYKLMVKGMKKTYNKVVDIGTKKEPNIATVTFGMWHEYFKDEDTGKKIKVERNMPIAINGKPSNYYHPLRYYKINDI